MALAQDEQTLFLSVVTIGELRKGFTLLPVTHAIAFEHELTIATGR
ncbi:MAG: hypothetical protein M1118_01860 [Chloroflexi bacterium]|nr:hypothetical protein [Chloroflexota bacterium]